MTRDRLAAATLVAVLHAAALWLLLRVHDADAPAPVQRRLASFDVREARPRLPPPPPRPHLATPSRTGHAAARATAAKPPVPRPASVVAAPVAIVPLPVIAVPPPGGGSMQGIGSGSGNAGVGAGAGGGGSRARLVVGVIRWRDYPEAERRAGIEGVVTVRFIVGIDGRVHDCAVARSSGNAALDAVTCRLIGDRFRYVPARDAAGRAVVEERAWQQRWWIEAKGDPR